MNIDGERIQYQGCSSTAAEAGEFPMQVFQAVAHGLERLGVDTVFGLMGDGNMRLLTYWHADLEHSFVAARHEAAGVAAADAYARVSGRIGVCTVTQGPGLTNSLTALVTARKARTPLLFLVGDVAAHQAGWPQDVDHAAFFAAAGVPLLQPTHPGSIFADVVRAGELAVATRGPVGIDLPTDFQEEEWDSWTDDLDAEPAPPVRTGPSAEQVCVVVDALLASARPVVLGGRGAVEADCAEALVDAADRTGALLATTLRGKGLFSGHPYGIGVVGGLGTGTAVSLMGEADLVLVVGASLTDFTLMRGHLLRPGCRVVVCDSDPAHRMTGHAAPPGTVVVTADAGAFTAAVVAELDRRGQRSEGFRRRADRVLAEVDPRRDFVPVQTPGRLDPRSATLLLDEHLPADRLVVTDAGHFFGNVVTQVDVPDGNSFVCGIDFGSIGLGLGHAIGAATACPDRPVVLVTGDGGLVMGSGDLETLVRNDLRVLVVVLDDAAYGSELQILRLWGLDESLSTFPDVDLSAVARGWGMPGRCVTSEDELVAALADLPLRGPSFIDCKISAEVCASWLEEAFRH